MKLRTKLFLSVGLLLVFIVLAIDGLVIFFNERDISQMASQVEQVIRRGHSEAEQIELLQIGRDIAIKIAIQVMGVAVVALLAALLILNRMAKTITQPITQLVGLTKKVAEGKYKEVVFPDVGKREDEIALLSRSFQEMVAGLEEREEIRGVLNKVVSKEVADEILKSKIHLGGEDRCVTMLFSDIRDFTQLTKDFSPQKTIHMLNQYMTKMSRIIEGEGGIIDKYVGDEIMALYGAPAIHPDHAIRALSAAKLMIETLKKWNEGRVAEGEIPLTMGIGIHTGIVVAGNMGAEDRLNYTVIGSNVNLAARLSQIAKPMQVVISETTLDAPKVRDSFTVEEMEPIQLKGFPEPVKVYQVVGFKW